MDRSVSKQFALGSFFGLMIMGAAMAGLAYRFGLQGFGLGSISLLCYGYSHHLVVQDL